MVTMHGVLASFMNVVRVVAMDDGLMTAAAFLLLSFGCRTVRAARS
jgi:hypothetical protein